MNRIRHILLLSLAMILLLVSACSSDDVLDESLYESSQSEASSREEYSTESSMVLSEPTESIATDSEVEIETENAYMKAVWLSQYDLMSVYRENGTQRPADSFSALMKTVLDNVAKDGYNAIFVQVRPFGDSMYPSEVYPVSSYVSGAYGNEDIYDPLEIIVALALERGLEVHGWINPMRTMKTAEIKSVPDSYLIKQWYNDENTMGDYLVEFDGRLYLNPAHPEVRNMIVEGAKEICEKYAVAGIHMDDYFYPTTDASFDQIAYDAYKKAGGTKSLARFRYENINALVRELYSGIKSVNEELQFGISPMGNLETSYTTLYTDVYTWCKEDGYIDYICPQIYFGLEHQTHDFKSVYRTWKAIIKNENVELYVGMTLGKAQSGVDNYAGTGKTEWADHKDVLKRCLEYLQTKEECTGVVFFCYQYMYDPVTGASVAETATERKNMKDALDALGNN